MWELGALWSRFYSWWEKKSELALVTLEKFELFVFMNYKFKFGWVSCLLPIRPFHRDPRRSKTQMDELGAEQIGLISHKNINVRALRH